MANQFKLDDCVQHKDLLGEFNMRISSVLQNGQQYEVSWSVNGVIKKEIYDENDLVPCSKENDPDAYLELGGIY